MENKSLYWVGGVGWVLRNKSSARRLEIASILLLGVDFPLAGSIVRLARITGEVSEESEFTEWAIRWLSTN